MKKKKQTAEKSPPEPSRRSFLNKVWMGLGILALVEFAGAMLVYFRTIKTGGTSGASKTVIEAGPVDQFSLNSVTAFTIGKFYLCRLDDGGFLAVSRKCTHLGCTVPWIEKEKRFACPCHGSAFDIRGAVVNAPAPRALDLYPLYIENNLVKVDISRQIKRSGFRADQVVYAKKAQI